MRSKSIPVQRTETVGRVTPQELSTRWPRLFHLTDAGAYASIQHFGLLREGLLHRYFTEPFLAVMLLELSPVGGSSSRGLRQNPLPHPRGPLAG
jgi:hypothetical protein